LKYVAHYKDKKTYVESMMSLKHERSQKEREWAFQYRK